MKSVYLSIFKNYNKLFITNINCKHLSSYLFVTGDKARDLYSPLQPYIDFNERVENIDELNENIKKRKLDIDVHELKKLWEFYKTRQDYKNKLESNRKEIKLSLSNLLSSSNSDRNKDDEIDALKLKFKLVRDDLKNITKTIWDIENNVVLKVLQVPNTLDSRVPITETVIDCFNDKPDSGLDHLEVGKKFNCLDFHDTSYYFLKNDLALFEIITTQYFMDEFKNNNFVQTCNADFARSVLIEGCTLKDEAPDVSFVLKNTEKNQQNKVYLTGGASFIPFFGLHTKQIINENYLPVRYVTQGRQYNPKSLNNFSGLYSVWQSTAVELFVGVSDDNDISLEFDNIVSNLINIYKTLDVHFRVVNVPVHELKPWESLRTSFQLYSPVNKAYVEIGNVSLIGNFLSKRLRAYYNSNENKQCFLNVISCTAVKIPILIASVLENSKEEICIPKVIKDKMIGF